MFANINETPIESRLHDMSKKVQQLVPKIQNEEGTKTSLVLPFLNYILGYNVFDPDEVVPEHTADMPDNNRESVDYAVMNGDGNPFFLIECKSCTSELSDANISQLARYFTCTDARFGVLTNGVEYRFYSDIDEQNIMDTHPFMEVNMLDVDSVDKRGLGMFTKDGVTTLDMALERARVLRYTNIVVDKIRHEFEEPSDDFVRHFADVYSGRKTQAVMELFGGIVRKAIQQYINGIVGSRLAAAVDAQLDTTKDNESASRIETTEDEWHAYYIVMAILNSHGIEASRISIKDNINYCNVIMDGSRNKIICRMYFNNSRKKIGLFNGSETKVDIDAIEDIFNHQQAIVHAAGMHSMVLQ